jgi:hypothetical protein
VGAGDAVDLEVMPPLKDPHGVRSLRSRDPVDRPEVDAPRPERNLKPRDLRVRECPGWAGGREGHSDGGQRDEGARSHRDQDP